MTTKFELTAKQKEANKIVASDATHIMFFGGSRSGKTFLHVRNIVLRALKAPRSRHAILRFRFNHIKSSIIFDTFPKVMEIAYPDIEYTLNKTDWFVTLPNGSEIWFGGLDDKERTEKILGNEYVTIYLNECSQIPLSGRNIVITRLAQLVYYNGEPLKPRMLYDCNPPNKSHWTYKLFIKHEDPESKKTLSNADDYVSIQMNPMDNKDNLSSQYLTTLDGLSERLKKRFVYGEFAEDNPYALFNDEMFDKWRSDELPNMIRIVVAVDPSGSDDKDNADNDAIGIIVAGLGYDGNCYVMEDCTIKAAPATWGKVASDAYERYRADAIVAETNFGGAMVEFVIKTANKNAKFLKVTASRGKSVRAEPVSALYEQGRVRHLGLFKDLEDELTDFSTQGYLGDKSPNRADALVWAVNALLPQMTRPQINETKVNVIPTYSPFAKR